jgi:hypothetical protein
LTTPFPKAVPDTFKEMVAWNDWAYGHGDRALDRITCDMLLGFTGLPQENYSRTVWLDTATTSRTPRANSGRTT